jgi:DNA polymerase-1
VTRWVFDLESNGLLDTISTIHCIVLRHVETDEVQTYGPDEIFGALFTLMNAEEVIGHNIIAYDIPALQKVYPGFDILGQVTDTLVLSRLICTTLAEEDSIRHAKNPGAFPRKLTGSHSLKAWGIRMSNHKGDYDGGWENYSEEMLDYCVQDTNVTVSIYKHFMAQGFSQESIDLEHRLAEVCLRIGNNGWTFDEPAAIKLYSTLAQKRQELGGGLDQLFPPWETTENFIPKVNNKKLGYVKGEVFVKRKEIQFNPGSRRHIEFCLTQKYAWKPKKFTNTGHAMIDETVLGGLPYPEAKKLAEYFMIQKRIGQLAEGPQAWLKRLDPDDGRIRHTIVSGGTVSGRAAHRGPNLAQVPKAGLLYGKECRDLFTVPDGWSLLGSDLSGLELRCLAHYLDDGGEYARQILEGDIHTHNQKAAGLDTRDQAKTFIYATMYGGGNQLIGKIAGGGAKKGNALKEAFNKNIPAFAQLKKNLQVAFRRGHLVGLDGRKLFVRSEHKLLSQLLQSSGAIICKKWVDLIDGEINRQYPKDAYIVGWIHDEVQIACRTEEVAQNVGDIARRMAQETGHAFKTKIPIAAEFSVGRTWSDTH